MEIIREEEVSSKLRLLRKPSIKQKQTIKPTKPTIVLSSRLTTTQINNNNDQLIESDAFNTESVILTQQQQHQQEQQKPSLSYFQTINDHSTFLTHTNNNNNNYKPIPKRGITTSNISSTFKSVVNSLISEKLLNYCKEYDFFSTSENSTAGQNPIQYDNFFSSTIDSTSTTASKIFINDCSNSSLNMTTTTTTTNKNLLKRTTSLKVVPSAAALITSKVRMMSIADDNKKKDTIKFKPLVQQPDSTKSSTRPATSIVRNVKKKSSLLKRKQNKIVEATTVDVEDEDDYSYFSASDIVMSKSRSYENFNYKQTNKNNNNSNKIPELVAAREPQSQYTGRWADMAVNYYIENEDDDEPESVNTSNNNNKSHVHDFSYISSIFKIRRYNLNDVKELDKAKNDLFKRYSFVNDPYIKSRLSNSSSMHQHGSSYRSNMSNSSRLSIITVNDSRK
jgi:hypothetical protein